MEKKLTKKEMFVMVLEMVKGNEMLVEFINHELELLNRKGSVKKPTKTQIENIGLGNEILEILINKGVAISIKEIITALDKDLSNQKVSAILKTLISNGKVGRIEDKKSVFFKAIV